MVPSTDIRTRTIGPTAIMAKAGWRTVTQKKTASTINAAAIVVLIDSVWRSVIDSVTVTEMMLSEVAVMSSPSPNHSFSMSSWIVFVCWGSLAKAGNCSKIASMPPGSLTRRLFRVGSFASSLSRNSCIRAASTCTPAEASLKRASSSGSYLSPGSPLS